MLTVRPLPGFTPFPQPRRYKRLQGERQQTTETQPDEPSPPGLPGSQPARAPMGWGSSRLKAHCAVTNPHAPALRLPQNSGVSRSANACQLPLPQQRHPRHGRPWNPGHSVPKAGASRMKPLLAARFYILFVLTAELQPPTRAGTTSTLHLLLCLAKSDVLGESGVFLGPTQVAGNK